MLTWVMALAVTASQVEVTSSDTVWADGRAYRLFRIDTPQLGTDAHCDLERQRAADLATFMNELVASARVVEIHPGYKPPGRRIWPHDHLGTRLARITVDGEDLGDILVEDGYAFRWDNRNKRNWCLPHP